MANRSTVTIDSETAENILKDVESMRKSLEALRKRVIKLLPQRYGSDAWWEKEIEEGVKEVKQGKYTIYKNVHDLINDLHAGR